jgi:hypothetical protein
METIVLFSPIYGIPVKTVSTVDLVITTTNSNHHQYPLGYFQGQHGFRAYHGRVGRVTSAYPTACVERLTGVHAQAIPDNANGH